MCEISSGTEWQRDNLCVEVEMPSRARTVDGAHRLISVDLKEAKLGPVIECGSPRSRSDLAYRRP